MTLTIVIPAYNEERIIERTIKTLFAFLDERMRAHKNIRVVVADNGSTDATAAIVRRIAAQEKRLSLLPVSARGKGNAVFVAWKKYPADVCVFMDADLSTDLAALPELLREIEEGADIAVASRFVPGSVVVRSLARRAFSRGLRLLLWVFFRLHVRDAPCGMKAVTRRVVSEVVPLVRDRSWFFDTELLIHAERRSLRIVEVPVRWADSADRDRPSRVGVIRVVGSYLLAIVRLRITPPSRGLRQLGPPTAPSYPKRGTKDTPFIGQ